MDSMIKKRIKRERTLNQPIIIDRFVDFRMEVLRNWNIKWNTSKETRIVKSVKDIVHEIQKKIKVISIVGIISEYKNPSWG